MTLTEKQKQIIEEMTNEFSTFNNRSKTNGGLIDVSRIKQNRKEDEEKRIEIKHRNKIIFENMRQDGQKIAEQLGKDLAELGLMVEFEKDHIRILSKTEHPSWKIVIELKPNWKYHDLSTKESIHCYVGWRYETSIINGHCTFKDINDLLNHPVFQAGLQRMYDEQQNKISLLR